VWKDMIRKSGSQYSPWVRHKVVFSVTPLASESKLCSQSLRLGLIERVIPSLIYLFR
jgi:hypothetical protein